MADETVGLALLPRHSSQLQCRIRSRDGLQETHILHFPDDTHFAACLNEPDRQALKAGWAQTGAVANHHIGSDLLA